MKKIRMTITIDEDIKALFTTLCANKKQSVSQSIEKFMKRNLAQNYDLVSAEDAENEITIWTKMAYKEIKKAQKK